ncbi:hypothetical protein BDZ94DRAFT_1194593 [Collybia nuda]|uniref:Uncharacterized protein n=1 Tax=Collybia nuda TaxID=64659 RepID=A0A9P5Y6Y8_9AGAR|nr:hypothetical protein BDZ94DRAFT_1194593 [Collybia nuda]
MVIRRNVPLALVLVVLVVTLCLLFYGHITTRIVSQGATDSCQVQTDIVASHTAKKPWESSNVVVGPRKQRYEDNLRNDTYYVTAWVDSGFSNQFIGSVNMIYLGTVSDRVPIISPFTPGYHVSRSAGPLPFGDVFNMSEFRRTLRTPILEWSEIKALAPRLSTQRPAVVEQLGCWSTRSRNQQNPTRPENLMNHLGLDVSYTRVPHWTRYNQGDLSDPHVALLPLAELIFPVDPNDKPGSDPIMAASPLGAKLGPDTRMACLDNLYFATVGTKSFEWEKPWSPVWRKIGRHLQFSDRVLRLTKGYLRRAFSVSSTDQLPPFISVHVRRGDFAKTCPDVTFGCLPPLAAYARHVKEVQKAIFFKHNIKVSEVLVASDELDPAFWNQVKAEGWKYIDHGAEQTFDEYGEWHGPIVDIVAQSFGIGFVGTKRSTVSLLSARRVQDWNQGVARMVDWNERG